MYRFSLAAMLLAVVLLSGCAGSLAQPRPAFDAAPVAPAQPLRCDMTAASAGVGFTLACADLPATATPAATATATSAATATAAPSFYYLWCAAGDASCAGRQAAITWDRAGQLLRCALPYGSKVTVIALDEGFRGDPAMAWLLTGADAGNGTPCEGWAKRQYIRAAQ
jgi:hypothetical protein